MSLTDSSSIVKSVVPIVPHVRHVLVADLNRAPPSAVDAAAADKRQVRVRLMGVVVGVTEGGGESRRPTAYLVDDGSGVIRVSHFLQERADRRAAEDERLVELEGRAVESGRFGLPDDLGAALERMLEEARARAEASAAPFAVGTCVEVTGRLQRFRGRNEVLAVAVRKVEDAADEVHRTLRLKRLAQEGVYSDKWI